MPSWVRRERSSESGEAEVAELRRAVVGEPDVAGLEVAVDHAARVGVLEGLAELRRRCAAPRRRRAGWRSAASKRALEVAAGHVLAHDEELAVRLADVVDGDDVRVVAEAAHRLGLAPHAHAAGLVEALGLDQREGDVAVEPLVAGQVDALLGALAEEALHLVAAGGEGG